MKRSPIRRRRRTKHQENNVQHAEYLHWVHSQPCAGCGYVGEAIQAAHVGQGGTGLKHGSDAETIPLCGPRRVEWQLGGTDYVGCHFHHDNCSGQFRLFTREQRRTWDADQVAVHQGRFEARNEGVRVVPF
jgi:hypothetical protein